jgi:hypothetical protein
VLIRDKRANRISEFAKLRWIAGEQRDLTRRQPTLKEVDQWISNARLPDETYSRAEYEVPAMIGRAKKRAVSAAADVPQ